MMNCYYRQRGVAIITALLIVAIATTVSVTISTRLQLDVRRTANMIANDQAYLYTITAENLGMQILKQDREEGEIDHLGENWALDIPPIPVEGGYIVGKLTDMQGCLNLNSLDSNATDPAVALTRLEMLLQNLGLQKRLAQGVVDWLDADLETKIPDGAEDSYYMNLDAPYRTANTNMASASELRLVKGFDDAEVYKTLLPHVCAFGISAPININTASAEVLRSLGDDLSESDIESVITQREEQAFNDLNEFQNSKTLKGKITSLEDLSVNSEYFMLRTESTIGQIRYIGYSIIQRNAAGTASVIARSQGVY